MTDEEKLLNGVVGMMRFEALPNGQIMNTCIVPISCQAHSDSLYMCKRILATDSVYDVFFTKASICFMKEAFAFSSLKDIQQSSN